MERSNEGLELNGIALNRIFRSNASLVLHFGLWPNPHARDTQEDKKIENKCIARGNLENAVTNYKRTCGL
jgi:hypothetical protein